MIDLTLINKANNIYGKRHWQYYFSPGRVNLIGEHIDYNGGFVLPCSLDIGISGLIATRSDEIINCYSESFASLGIISFNLYSFTKDNNWVDYVKGIIKEVKLDKGFDLYIHSNLPEGAGLSSSASLELLILEMLNHEFNLYLSKLDMVKMGVDAENTYIGVKCGIMDQFAISHGKKSQAIFLNTKTYDYEYVNCNFLNYQLVIANTNKKRTLTNSFYNKRREECEKALELINNNYQYLCEASLDETTKINDEVLKRRAFHVISENIRVQKAKMALQEKDIISFGQLMDESHQSLKDDYVVSCFELDTLVSLFKEEGAIGARMTGAGFGGCIVALIEKLNLDDKLALIKDKYKKLTNLQCDFYLVNAGSATRKISYDINYYLNQLVQYGLNKNILEEDDLEYVINSLIKEFNLSSFTLEQGDNDDLDNILNNLSNYQIENNALEGNITIIDNFKAEVIDMLMDRPKTVNNKFWVKYEKSPMEATQYFHKLCCDVNYIQTTRIKKNINWEYKSKYGKLLLTINLSKPEKDPFDISKAQDSLYPKCQLCKENIGFYGNNYQESRRNLRAIKVNLNNEDYYFQYSPYAYFNEHAIIFNYSHKPMVINEGTFKNLVRFLELFPHYFIGSNADLPIVGGSILNHDHYQAGNFSMPITKAKEEFVRKFKDVDIYKLLWPLSTIRLKTNNKESLIAVAALILKKWQTYHNQELMIINNGEIHNTITPILFFDRGIWAMDLILRNNYTNKEYPYGVFHPHEKLHHIKKENIGLIEAMGLAILPPRLKNELLKIELILSGNNTLLQDKDLEKHLKWITYLQKHLYNQNVHDYLLQETAKVFEQVLEDCGVFKDDKSGKETFKQFIDAL